MGIKNKISPGYIYFLTLTVIDWVDVFTRPEYKYIVIDSLDYCQKNKGLKIYAWCLMSNHLHMIVGTEEENNLSDILRDFKKFTSKEIIDKIKELPESRKEWMLNRFEFAGRFNNKIKDYKFWQDGNEAKEIHTNEFLDQKLDYIHNNPVRAEIVFEPQDYKYSSAIDYSGGKGLLVIKKI
jgi:REP element-mobilizing transposase RayT